MTNDEDRGYAVTDPLGRQVSRQKKRKRLRRNHLAKALEDRLFRQRKISKDYKKKRINEIEDSYKEILKDDLYSD